MRLLSLLATLAVVHATIKGGNPIVPDQGNIDGEEKKCDETDEGTDENNDNSTEEIPKEDMKGEPKGHIVGEHGSAINKIANSSLKGLNGGKGNNIIPIESHNKSKKSMKKKEEGGKKPQKKVNPGWRPAGARTPNYEAEYLTVLDDPLFIVSRRGPQSADFVFAATVNGKTEVPILIDTGSSNTWVFSDVLPETSLVLPLKGPHNGGHRPRQKLLDGDDYTLKHFVEGPSKMMVATEGTERSVWTGKLWMILSSGPRFGGVQGLLSAGAKSDLGKSGFALVPFEGGINLFKNFDEGNLASAVCRRDRLHAQEPVNKHLGYWDVEGFVGINNEPPTSERWRLSTGSRMIELRGEAWNSFKKVLRHNQMDFDSSDKVSGEPVVKNCGADTVRGLPSIKIKLTHFTFYILPQEYVVPLKDGKCLLRVSRRKGDGISILGAPFLRNVVSVFGKDGVKLCAPKGKRAKKT